MLPRTVKRISNIDKTLEAEINAMFQESSIVKRKRLYVRGRSLKMMIKFQTLLFDNFLMTLRIILGQVTDYHHVVNVLEVYSIFE